MLPSTHWSRKTSIVHSFMRDAHKAEAFYIETFNSDVPAHDWDMISKFAVANAVECAAYARLDFDTAVLAFAKVFDNFNT